MMQLDDSHWNLTLSDAKSIFHKVAPVPGKKKKKKEKYTVPCPTTIYDHYKIFGSCLEQRE